MFASLKNSPTARVQILAAYRVANALMGSPSAFQGSADDPSGDDTDLDVLEVSRSLEREIAAATGCDFTALSFEERSDVVNHLFRDLSAIWEESETSSEESGAGLLVTLRRRFPPPGQPATSSYALNRLATRASVAESSPRYGRKPSTRRRRRRKRS